MREAQCLNGTSFAISKRRDQFFKIPTKQCALFRSLYGGKILDQINYVYKEVSNIHLSFKIFRVRSTRVALVLTPKAKLSSWAGRHWLRGRKYGSLIRCFEKMIGWERKLLSKRREQFLKIVSKHCAALSATHCNARFGAPEHDFTPKDAINFSKFCLNIALGPDNATGVAQCSDNIFENSFLITKRRDQFF